MLSKNRGEEIVRIESGENQWKGRGCGGRRGSWKAGGEAGRGDFLDQAFRLSIVDAGGANEISLELSTCLLGFVCSGFSGVRGRRSYSLERGESCRFLDRAVAWDNLNHHLYHLPVLQER